MSEQLHDQKNLTWIDWAFIWLWWIILNTAAWSVSWASGVIGLMLVGVVVGFAQRLVLRNFISNTRVWVLVTGIVLGLSLPMSMFMFFMVSLDQAISVGAITGAIVGFAQRIVLHHHVEGARWWTPFSIVGMTAGFYLGMFVFYEIFQTVGSVLHNALVGGIIGAVYGIITGGILVWLLQRLKVTEE